MDQPIREAEAEEVLVSLSWRHNLSSLSLHTRLQVPTDYFITALSRHPASHLSVGLNTVCSCTEPWLGRAPWARETLYLSVSHQPTLLLFSTCSDTKLRPWRAIDFNWVISVFPLTGRKWNNNRGERETHGPTLWRTGCLIHYVDFGVFLVFLMRHSSHQ